MTFLQGKKKFKNHKADNLYCDCSIELYKLKIIKYNDYWSDPEKVGATQKRISDTVVDYCLDVVIETD